jgi:hypothetical protein
MTPAGSFAARPVRRAGRWWFPVLLLATLAGGGCGSEPFSFIPVTGKVTYADKSTISGAGVIVRFVPTETHAVGKDVAGAGTGLVSAQDGTFPGLTTHRNLDGVVAGHYKVVVIAVPKGPPVAGQPAQDFKAIPRRYQDAAQTPFEVEVSRSKNYFEFEIEKPK